MKNFLLLSTLLLMLLAACSKEDIVDTSLNQIEDISSLQDFEASIANGVSVIFFHASWCSICAEQRPAFEATAEKSDFNTVFFGEVEYEDNTDINQAYNVSGFPTMVFFKDGVEENRLNGKNHSESDIATIINDL